MNVAKIVLVEDNPADVYLIEMALQEHKIPYELTRFENGNEAVKALCSPNGTAFGLLPDAILLDLNTPGSEGFDVLKELKTYVPLAHVPVAIISSSQANSDKHRAALTGAVRYIEKPSQLNEFLTTVGLAVKDMLSDRALRK